MASYGRVTIVRRRRGSDGWRCCLSEDDVAVVSLSGLAYCYAGVSDGSVDCAFGL